MFQLCTCATHIIFIFYVHYFKLFCALDEQTRNEFLSSGTAAPAVDTVDTDSTDTNDHPITGQ